MGSCSIRRLTRLAYSHECEEDTNGKFVIELFVQNYSFNW